MLNYITNLLLEYKIPERDAWFLPEQVSTYAADVDKTFRIEYYICFFFGTLIYLLTAYFCIKYRKREGNSDLPPHIRHNYPLEIVWTIIPTIVCFWMFFVGADGYLEVMGAPPKDARVVHVTGKQWSWEFAQEDEKGGMHKSDVLYLAKGVPVQLRMRSDDVLHSLYMPGMRGKMDVVPNKITTLNLTPIKTGTYDLFCTEYCGRDHSIMITHVTVVEPEELYKYVKPTEFPNPFEVYKRQCQSCHTLDGSSATAPTWKGLWGKIETVTTNGQDRQIKVDAEYIKKSVRNAAADLAKPFAGGMNDFPETAVSDRELNALIAWIRYAGENNGQFPKDYIYKYQEDKIVPESTKEDSK